MADEEVTDLTEGEEAGSTDTGKKKGAKAPKEPKAPKEKKDPKDKKQKGSKEKGGAGGIIIIMILVLLILIGGFAAALYFDIFDSRVIIADIVTDPLLDIIIWLDPGYSSINQRLASERELQERQFEERKADLDTREEDVLLREEILNSREQFLDRKAFDLDRREEQIIAMYERTIPLHRRDMSDEELADMISLSRTYTQMSPDSAAEILVELYDPRDVAAILYYMGERNAASILAVMNVSYAAEITEILLYS
ncbi:MAG: hypothetical protein FWD38_09850 [Oscillospiraceae bacterium]|nr:hypothetical protein [Oscillospiraceae bacterium]